MRRGQAPSLTAFPGSRVGLGSQHEAYLTTEQAAVYLGLSVEALRMRVYRGQLPTRRLGRHLRFKRSELDQLLVFAAERRRS